MPMCHSHLPMFSLVADRELQMAQKEIERYKKQIADMKANTGELRIVIFHRVSSYAQSISLSTHSRVAVKRCIDLENQVKDKDKQMKQLRSELRSMANVCPINFLNCSPCLLVDHLHCFLIGAT